MVAAYVFLALAVMSYVFIPLFRPQKRLDEQSRQADRRRQLLEERERVYASIRDLDFDFRTGKLEEADHKSARAELTAAAVTVLKQLDESSPKKSANLDDDLEQEIAAARKGKGRTPVAARFCASCGKSTPAEAQFCPSCGKAIAVA